MTRRAAIGAAGLGLAGSLAACGGDDGETGGGGPAGGASTDAPTATGGGTPGSSGSGPSAQAGAGPELPTYHQQRVSTPTSPAVDYDGYGAEALFDGYPDQPKSFFNGAVPGEGGPLTAMSIINLTIKYGSSNAFWTELLKRLGVDLKPQGGPSSGYVAKFNTAIAGGQIADAMQIIPGTVSRLPDVLKADFQDLTEFVSGDAIKDYPALANIPTASWKSTVFNNGIYAIPLHRSSLMWAGTARMDLLKAKGLPTAPTSGEELLQMFRGLSAPG